MIEMFQKHKTNSLIMWLEKKQLTSNTIAICKTGMVS